MHREDRRLIRVVCFIAVCIFSKCIDMLRKDIPLKLILFVREIRIWIMASGRGDCEEMERRCGTVAWSKVLHEALNGSVSTST